MFCRPLVAVRVSVVEDDFSSILGYRLVGLIFERY